MERCHNCDGLGQVCRWCGEVEPLCVCEGGALELVDCKDCSRGDE